LKEIDWELIEAEYQAGKSLYELKAEYGIWTTRLRRKLRGMGIKMRNVYQAYQAKKGEWRKFVKYGTTFVFGLPATLSSKYVDPEKPFTREFKILSRKNRIIQLKLRQVKRKGKTRGVFKLHHSKKTKIVSIPKRVLDKLGIDCDKPIYYRWMGRKLLKLQVRN